jgi:TonB family protein
LLRGYADMSAASNGRVLRIAIAGSLAVHLIFAAIVYSHPVAAAPEQKPHDTIIIHLPPPTRTPPPRKPAVPHPQRKSEAVHVPVRLPVLPRNPNPKGPPENPPVEPTGEPMPSPDGGGVVTAPTSAPLAPTPTPKPACSAPDIGAKAIDPRTPDEPEAARDQGLIGTVKVKVDLDPSGSIVGASVYESSGSMELDNAALAAARQTHYAPEERDCKNVPGSYLFTVDFQ